MFYSKMKRSDSLAIYNYDEKMSEIMDFMKKKEMLLMENEIFEEISEKLM